MRIHVIGVLFEKTEGVRMGKKIGLLKDTHMGLLRESHFCSNCRDMVNVNISNIGASTTINNITVEYEAPCAICETCGQEVYVEAVVNESVFNANEAYKKLQGIITVKEIKAILEQYAIAARPLSKLLGWGEHTLKTYIDKGKYPKKDKELLLRKIQNPKCYLDLLNKNSKRITQGAYTKSLTAVTRLINELNNVDCYVVEKEIFEIGFDYSDFHIEYERKIDIVVKYLLLNVGEITHLGLQKLLYYAQGFNLAFTGDSLFDDDCQAWVHGPVYPYVYHNYKKYGGSPINFSKEDKEVNLSSIETAIIDGVIESLGCFSGKVLEKLTHNENPWIDARVGVDSYDSSNNIIKKEAIMNYFKHVKSKYNMYQYTDIREYAKDQILNGLYR